MKVLITGVAGFLGSHLADAMLARGHQVRGVDNLLGGYMDNIPDGVVFLQGDCCDWDVMDPATNGIDLVYHCAATAYEGLSVFSPSLISRNIVDASVTTFSAAIHNGVKRIVHCSSMARYGALLPPFKESMICMPQDPYGIAKVCAEQMLKNLCEVHDVEYVIAVPHNIIGPRQKYDDPYRNVASIMMNIFMQGRTPIIYGDGQQQRCFSFVEDCLSCLVGMGVQEQVVGEVINIGPDENPISINDLYEEIRLITGSSHEMPVYMPGRPQEVKIALCSSEKARAYLGYQTKTSLQQGLKAMHKWMGERGTRPFKYHLPLEIVTARTPQTWTKRLF